MFTDSNVYFMFTDSNVYFMFTDSNVCFMFTDSNVYFMFTDSNVFLNCVCLSKYTECKLKSICPLLSFFLFTVEQSIILCWPYSLSKHHAAHYYPIVTKALEYHHEHKIQIVKIVCWIKCCVIVNKEKVKRSLYVLYYLSCSE